MIQPVEWPFNDLVLGAWLATGILFCLYNLLAGLILREHWLAMIILPGAAFIAIEFAYFGLLSTALPAGVDLPTALAWLGCVTVAPTVLATVSFTRHFLQLPRRLPEIDHQLRLIAIASFIPLAGLAFLPLEWVAWALFGVVCIGALVATRAHWHIWRLGGLDGRLIGVSWLPMGPALVAWFGRNLGIFDGGATVTLIYLSGFGANLIILSVTSVARLKVLNNQAIGALRAARRKNADANRLETQLRDEIEQRSLRLGQQKARADQEYENKRALVSLISHDLRGPLANAAQALDRVVNDPEPAGNPARNRLLERVHETVQRQVSLVDRLLDVETLSEASRQTGIHGVDLHRIAEQRIAHWQAMAADRGIRLHNQTPRDGLLYGDALLIDTLLDNLLANALRHTGESGDIEIALCEGERNGFAVSNTTALLSDDDIARILASTEGTVLPERDARNASAGEASTMELGSGRNIGLRLARSLINSHGGRLDARVTPRRVTFEVRLPAVRPLILLVDDQVVQLMEMRDRILATNPDFEVAEALGVDQAIDAIRRRIPALVISDVRMPDKDGFALLAAIRSHGAWEEIRVVLASAVAADEEARALRRQAMQAGADGFSTKPLEAAVLTQLLDGLMPAAQSVTNA